MVMWHVNVVDKLNEGSWIYPAEVVLIKLHTVAL